MKSKLFDNLFWTRMNIKKIHARKIDLDNENLLILFFTKKKENYSHYDDDYYDKVDFLKQNQNTKKIDILNALDYLKENLELLRTKNVLLVGYAKSIAWIYRYLINEGIQSKIVI